MHLRRAFVWNLLLLIVLLASACGDSSDQATPVANGTPAVPLTPQQGGTLTMSMGADFVTFHPYFDVENSNFKPQFYEAPIRIGDDGDFEPWLAESWEQAADGLSVSLHLRQGIKFHTGREMTAEDVVWSVSHARDTEYGHQLSTRFQTVTGAIALDSYTVRISYSERTASQLDGIARLYIFPQEALGTIDTVPVGTGPFKFVEWIPGDSLTIERFDDYWREGLPYLDKVVVKPILDAETRVESLRLDTLDLLMNVPLVDKRELATEEGIVVGADPPGFSFYAFLMNINAPPFDNVLVRQALNYALNRQEIVDSAFYGQAVTVTVPYPPNSWVYADDLTTYYSYNPEKAKELLAQAGYPDGFSIQMMLLDSEGPHLVQAQLYQQQLAKIGVQVALLPLATPDYWENLYASNFAIVSHVTGNSSVDPSGLFESAACCRSVRSFFGVEYTQEELKRPEDQRVARVDAWFLEYRQIIHQAHDETDHAARKALYHRALEILLEQGWAIPTVWNQASYAHWDTVQDFRTDLDGSIWLGETWLIP